ncbi:MAG: hypothetical protein K6U08_07265, partial [Firmicutes bacterium]|nr:hypothetical protein [Bacillota bacterium]
VYGAAWERPWPEDPWYHLARRDGDDATYLPGETARLVVRADQQEVGPRPQGFLFYTARLGLDEVWVQDEPECSVVFEERFIPNTSVGGVYFDGRTYHTLWPVAVRYRYRERELDVRVSLDKPEYRPGETARITVEVRDRVGRPVAADVNLSMVDEALYQLAPERVDFLFAVYGSLVRSLVLASTCTHSRLVLYGGGAEGGGEGGGARSDFRDSAFFESVTTGPDGRAAVEVTLPSNLTSWRLTYHVFASGVRGASGTVGIPVRLPFFVHLSTARTYLSGDRPVILGRAYGTSLPPGMKVTFEGELKRLDADGKVAATYRLEPVQGVAGQPVELDLGRAAGGLEKGRWLLTVGGKAVLADGRVLEDRVEVPLDVLDTYVRLDRVEYYEVAEGLKLTAEPGEVVTLTFCDAARGRQLALLERLASGGRRVDMKAAQAVAYRLLADHFGLAEDLLPRPPAPAELALYQRHDGGVAVLPYGGSELELTAKIAALGTEGFDRTGLLAYLGRVYDDEAETRERRCVALWGLAALEEPVLLDLQKAAAAPDLSPQESLYIALGLIELGDEELARVVFGRVLERYGDPVGRLLRLNVSRDQEEIVRATSLAALVAAELGLAEAERLLDYLVSNEPWEELNFLELALALKESVPRTPAAPATFTLKPEGVRVELENGQTYTRILTAEDLARLEFAEVRGGVTLCVAYRAPVDLGRTKVRSGEAAVERTYSVSGRAGTSFKAGDLVKVTLSYRISGQAPEGAYQLVDFLPSGLACVARPWEYWGPPDQNLGCPVEVDGQRVVFGVYNTLKSDPVTGKPLPRGTSGTITYYARVVSLGSFRAEPAVLVHVESGEFFAVTRQAEVTIR